jgi:hypothetical protein
MFIHGYRKFYNLVIDLFNSNIYFRLITHDDSLVYEAKHVFRFLLATVIRRIQNVKLRFQLSLSKIFFSSS